MSLLSTLILDAGEQPPQTYDGKTLSVSEVQGDSVKHTYMPIGEEVSEAEFNARFRNPTPMFNVRDFFRQGRDRPEPIINYKPSDAPTGGKTYIPSMGTPSEREKELRTPFRNTKVNPNTGFPDDPNSPYSYENLMLLKQDLNERYRGLPQNLTTLEVDNQNYVVPLTVQRDDGSFYGYNRDQAMSAFTDPLNQKNIIPFGGESYLAEQFAGGIPTKLSPEARRNIMNALLATQMQKTKQQGML